MREEDDGMTDISDLRVGIAGFGLIGGSLAAALEGSVREISAWDAYPEVLERGLEMGFSFRPCGSPEEFANSSDVIILAVPLRNMKDISQKLEPLFEVPPQAVLDTGSTKKSVGEVLSSIWGRSYVGLHPMAGKEYSGIDNASSDLFRKARCAIVPGPHSEKRAVMIAENIVKAVGSVPVFLEPAEHDIIAGCVSHIPITLASAMSCLAGEELKKHPDLCSMVAGGFRDTTRLGSGPPWLLADMWETNGKILDGLLERLIDILQEFRKASPGEIEEMAEKARQAREKIIQKSGN